MEAVFIAISKKHASSIFRVTVYTLYVSKVADFKFTVGPCVCLKLCSLGARMICERIIRTYLEGSGCGLTEVAAAVL
jgi:hypothetical protein